MHRNNPCNPRWVCYNGNRNGITIWESGRIGIAVSFVLTSGSQQADEGKDYDSALSPVDILECKSLALPKYYGQKNTKGNKK